MNLLQAVDCSASNADSNGGSESSRRAAVVHEKGLWTALPEEVFTLILRALPPSAYCRLRCVCKAWKRLLSSSPDWTYWTRTGTPCFIATTWRNFDVDMLCFSDEKFLRLPFNEDLSLKLDTAVRGKFYLDWNLLDVDEGLFCYHIRSAKDSRYLAVCDPLTQAYRITLPRKIKAHTFKVKLLVDREKQAFQIVVAGSDLMETYVFDSTVSRWKTFHFSYPYHADKIFMWKKVLYAYATYSKFPDYLYSFDSGSGDWNKVEATFPGGEGDRHILSDKKQVIFVRSYDPGQSFPLSMWKLKDKESLDSNQGPDFSLSMWENLSIDQRLAIPDASTRRFDQVCCGTGYMCFVFRATTHKRISDIATMVSRDDICVKYSLVTGESSVIPFPSKLGIEKLFPWEPNVDPEFKY